jgi:hypothetical protein
MSWAELGENPIVLECAGPQGPWRGGRNRPNLWILWRYDRPAGRWQEIARALSTNWDWALVLREPAIRALRPVPDIADFSARGREVTEELLRAIDAMLVPELPAVRALVLTSIYDRMAGKIVA